ncbi:MAG TPA: ABC transporter substrate-binding protein [Thermodesulfobacteriota bacterium]|nr:ABC transporter substrate-binding protein [Thermodesulfobacteriota bacterium]
MLKRNLVLVCLLALASFLVVTPVSAQKVRGVTDTEILIGQWGPQTGPAAPWGAVARGTDLLVKIINEEGGIHGRKFKYYLRDDSYQPAKTKAIAKEFVEEIGVFGVIGGVGVACGMTARDYLMENKVPWCGPATGVYDWITPIQKYLFAVYPLYDDEAFTLTGYLYEKLGYKKIGMFYQNDDYGKQGMMGVERYLLKKNIKLVEKVSAEVTDRDLSTHALKLKNSGADAVVMWAMPTHAALILTESAKIGFRPQWATSSTLSDAPLMMQITKGLWSGMINSIIAELPDSNHPLMVKYREWHKKLAPQERWGFFYYGGITLTEPFFEGVRRAGRNLTTETWVSAMETLKNWKGIGPPITYGKPTTPMGRQGGRHVFYGKVKPDGNIERLTDWIQITK